MDYAKANWGTKAFSLMPTDEIILLVKETILRSKFAANHSQKGQLSIHKGTSFGFNENGGSGNLSNSQNLISVNS